MSSFDSFRRSIQNVFVGSHKGEDFNIKNTEEMPEDDKYDPPEGEYLPEVDLAPSSYEPPDYDREEMNNEWFKTPHPHDNMPIANGSNRYAPPEKIEELKSMETNPRPEEEIADWFSIEKPDESDVIEEEKTMHQKMYEIATARNNPFHVGGSENAQSEVDYIKKHSPWEGGSENFQARRSK